ncbi:universal stress protein [Streptomyces sp. NPDC017949]|uniref:universal stress protein n=1 Tax=Streptomyces sp. NPDC017949 TaxID=3365020 RepID=UPI0037A1902C
MKNHVTVGVDGSAESRAAAHRAAQEPVLRQVPLRLVHAVDRPLDPGFPGPGRQDVDHWADRPTFGARLGPITHAVMHHATSPVAVVAHD